MLLKGLSEDLGEHRGIRIGRYGITIGRYGITIRKYGEKRMKKKNGIIVVVAVLFAVLSVLPVPASEGEKILRTAASFAYPSLDVHKEYYGW